MKRAEATRLVLETLTDLEGRLDPKEGVSMPALANYLGLQGDDRKKLSVLLLQQAEASEGERRGATVYKTERGGWRTTLKGRQGVLKESDDYAQVLLDLIRMNGGILRVIDARGMLGFRRHPSLSADENELRYLQFKPYERVAQESPKIGRDFGVAMGQDGYINVPFPEFDSTVLSGWTHAVIMRCALKVYPASFGADPDIIVAKRNEGFVKLGGTLRSIRKDLRLDILDLLDMPGVVEQLNKMNHRKLARVIALEDIADMLAAEGIDPATMMTEDEKQMAKWRRPVDPLRDMRQLLRERGRDPRLAAPATTLEQLELGNENDHLQAPAGLFSALARGYRLHAPALSRGFIQAAAPET